VGALEEFGDTQPSSSACSKRGQWDQFKANEKLFGVKSTFKSDLSQYTTKLDVKNVPAEMRRRAERLAAEIESKKPTDEERHWADVGDEYEIDEDQLFSAVDRGATSAVNRGNTSEGGSPSSAARGYPFGESGSGGGGAPDGGAGGALLAALRVAAPAGAGVSSGYRGLVQPRVQAWWRAQRLAGVASLPAGAEDSLICPFSRRVFGDVSQLVAHWAASLPTASNTGDGAEMLQNLDNFQRAGRELTWAAVAAATGLETMLPLAEPRPGSVWEQVLIKVSSGQSVTPTQLAQQPIGAFVTAAMQIRCWRRDQRVEHREVLEGVVACQALHALD
jgi:hypothetical protein